MILNLANASNGDIQYKIISFPDGDKHIDLQEGLPFLNNTNTLTIKIRIRSIDDVFVLKQAVHILRGYKESLLLNLDIVYMLGARYDREMHDNDVCSLQLICDDINALNFRSIRVLEPHSAATTLLLKRSKAYTAIDNVAALHAYTCVVAPDLGAVKRVNQFIKNTTLSKLSHVNIILTDKTRILSTGEITGIKVFNPGDIEERVLIYDDLCDGGRTFIELAKELRKHGAKKITLAITHGIFSKGIGVLLDGDDGGYVDQIITTNSFDQKVSTQSIIVINVI